MAAYFSTSIAPGQYFYVTDADPNAVITAPRGSVALRVDAGNVAVYLNTTSAAVWAYSPTITTGVLSLLGVDSILLNDNDATALDIGSTGLLNLLRFITTDGAERIQYNGVLPFNIVTGGLLVSAGTVGFPAASVNLNLPASVGADLSVSTAFTLRMDVGAGLTATATLPARAGGWRIVEVWIVSGGATAGTITVNNVTAGLAVTNAMVPGNAGIITRTTTAANANIAGGGQITAVGAGNPASVCYLTLLPL